MTKKTVLLLLLLLVMFAPSLALAGSFDIPAGDKSKEIWLDALFGPLVGGDAAGSNPLGPLFGVLNAVVLFVAGILIAYQLLAGTLATAHEGEVLGKRWSSVWIGSFFFCAASFVFSSSTSASNRSSNAPSVHADGKALRGLRCKRRLERSWMARRFALSSAFFRLVGSDGFASGSKGKAIVGKPSVLPVA
jgi:hypothetical protein